MEPLWGGSLDFFFLIWLSSLASSPLPGEVLGPCYKSGALQREPLLLYKPPIAAVSTLLQGFLLVSNVSDDSVPGGCSQPGTFVRISG